jgi:hypothetical protein
VLLVGFGPEKREKGIPPVKAIRGGRGKVGEQREALGLGEDGARLRPMQSHGGSTEEAKLD